MARNSKAKSKSFRKIVEKRIILLESFFYILAAYFCTKGFTTCTKGENYVLSSESESESLALDDSVVFVSCFYGVGLFVLFLVLFMSSQMLEKGKSKPKDVG